MSISKCTRKKNNRIRRTRFFVPEVSESLLYADAFSGSSLHVLGLREIVRRLEIRSRKNSHVGDHMIRNTYRLRATFSFLIVIW